MNFRRPHSISFNNSKHPILFPICCNLPPLPSSGRGLGRGWLYELHEFIFSSETQSHPHPNLPPPDGGRNRIADKSKRSSENYNLGGFRRPRLMDSNNSKPLTPATIPFHTFPHLPQPAPSPVRRERAGERVAL